MEYQFDVVLTVHRWYYVEIKCQLDATDEFLLQILLLAQLVSGTFMPLIRSSRVFYKWLQSVVFGAWFSSCRCSVELRVVCPVCGKVVGTVWSWGLCVRCAGSSPQTGHTTLNSTLHRQLENQAPNMTDCNHLYNTLELLMRGIKVPKTCWVCNKICNKNSSVASSSHFIST
jgi:hypothetical protein